MIAYRPDRVLVQNEAWEDPLCAEILARLPGVHVQTIVQPDDVLPELMKSSDPHTSAKRTLILTRFPGQFMKPCPGSGAEICCNYYVLNYASNCHMECTYCVLQTYLNNPALMVFTNVGDMLREVSAKLEENPTSTCRIGTGEMADSLALDAITEYSRILVPFFGRQRNGILELKTKSDQIQNLEGLDHNGRTVVSWSLNSRPIARSDELKTASLESRIEAARRCQEWGYRVGFHFDPIVHYDGWQQDYEEVVRLALRSVDPEKVAWISLGALRFTPHLRDIMRSRFPKSRIPFGEFVPGHHGKLRYFRPIREEIYRRMREWITREAPGVMVYLCMESSLVWNRALGFAPGGTEDLSLRMDARVCRTGECCGSASCGSDPGDPGD
jgi:spore photoproduct lyase